MDPLYHPYPLSLSILNDSLLFAFLPNADMVSENISMNHCAIMAANSMLVLTFPAVFTPHSQHMTWRGEIKTLLFVFLCHILSSQPWRGKNEMKCPHLHLLPLPSQLDMTPSG